MKWKLYNVDIQPQLQHVSRVCQMFDKSLLSYPTLILDIFDMKRKDNQSVIELTSNQNEQHDKKEVELNVRERTS